MKPRQGIFISVVFLLFLLITLYFGYLSDDAFISFRYAKNFVEGNGLVYNSGEKVEGYSNFLWVLICSIPILLNLDPLIFARIISLASVFGFFFLLYYISKKIFDSKSYYYLISIALFAFSPGVIAWSYSGLETLFFTFLVTMGIAFVLFFIKDKSIHLISLSFLCFLLAALTRADGIIFGAVTAVFLFFAFRKDNRIFKKIIFTAAIFFVMYGIYFLWRYDYYGFLFPNTFYAKVDANHHAFIRGGYYIFKFLRESLANGFLFIFIFYYIYKNYKNIVCLYLNSILLFYTAYIVFIGGDGLGIQRFFVPVMPVIFLLVQAGLENIISDFNVKKVFSYALIFFILFSSLIVTADLRRQPMQILAATKEEFKNYIKVGEWLKNNSSKDEVLAVFPAGIIPYISGLKTIDRYGLNDVIIAHTEISDMGTFTAGHEKANDEYVFSRKPDYVMNTPPTIEKLNWADTSFYGVPYKFYSVPIGKGTCFTNYGKFMSGDLYFNFYKLQR